MIRFIVTQVFFLVALVVGPLSAEVILSTDFTDRTVDEDTASNITYVTSGLADPGDLTVQASAGNEYGGEFLDGNETGGHLVTSANIVNQGNYYEIPLTFSSGVHQLSFAADDYLVIDYGHFNSQGFVRGAGRVTTWTAKVVGSVSGELVSDMVSTTSSITGTIQLFDGSSFVLGSGETWTLTLQVTASGTANRLGFDGFSLNGTVENELAPTFEIAGDQEVDEDSGAQAVAGFVTDFDANNTGQTLSDYTVTVTSGGALFSVAPDVDSAGELTYTPAAEASGVAVVEIYATDTGVTGNQSATRTFNITINEVNDSPEISGPASLTVDYDTVYSQANFLTFDVVETGQTVESVSVTLSNSGIFDVVPVITTAGTLSFEAGPYNGTCEVDVTIVDDGGNSNGGDDESEEFTFTITIENEPDRIPTFDIAGNQSVDEDSGAESVADFVSNFDPQNSGQSLSDYTVTVTAGAALFAVAPDVDTSGELSYTPADEASGVATVEIYATDTGVTNRQSATQSFSITINEVNDPPVVSGATELRVDIDSNVSLANFLTFDPVEAGQVISEVTVVTDDPSLFVVEPAVGTDGSLSFEAGSANGSTIVRVQVTDDGGTSNRGDDLSEEFAIALTIEYEKIYVNVNTPASIELQDGQSWATAYASLQDALVGSPLMTQIWVAQGVYYTDPSDRTVSFAPKSDTEIFGGFLGTETLVEEAQPDQNLTVLSGDIDGNDTKDGSGVTLSYSDLDGGSNNTQCLLSFSGVTGVVIDGFVICGGKDGLSTQGGGVNLTGDSAVTIRNCVIRGNQAGSGGGVYLAGSSSSLILEDTQIFQNEATSAIGGGICVAQGMAVLNRVEVRGNQAANGGGLYASAGTTSDLESCLFGGNAADQYGGGLFLGGFFEGVNLTIAGNQAGFGDGVVFAGATAEFKNTILWGNGDEPINTVMASTVSWEESLVEGSGGDSWNAAYGSDGGGNLDEDPHFTNPTASGFAPFITGDFTFGDSTSSPGSDAGGNEFVSSETDLLGSARLNGRVDMGAYEENSTLRPTFVLAGDQTVLEDSGETTLMGLVSDFDPQGSGEGLLGYTVTTNRSSYFSVQPTMNTSGDLNFTVAEDQSGTARITVYAFDDGSSFSVSNGLSFNLNLIEVNDPPSFTMDQQLRAPLTTEEQVFYHFAYNVDTEELGQSYSFVANPDDAGLFAVDGLPSIDEDGTLRYTLASTSVGTTEIVVTLQDDGGTENGGVDSVAQTLTFYASYTNSYGIQGAGFHSEAYTELGALNVLAGQSILIDTDTGTISGDVSFAGAVVDYSEDGEEYRLFNFSSIDIAAGATIVVTGEMSLALTSTSTISIAADLALIAGAGEDALGLSVVAKESLSISGNLSADGGNGASASDGGAGGLITLGGNSVVIAGNISARGGDGGDDAVQGGDGGNGGEVVVINNDFGVGGFDVSGGSGGVTGGFDGADGGQIQDQTPGYLRDVIYVDLEAEGSNNGATWNDAYRDLQDAIDSASAGDQIWVAAGMYVPTGNEEDRDASFVLKSGVSLFGGFFGGVNSLHETDDDEPWVVNLAGESSVDQADPFRSTRFTNLSGDIKFDDTRDRRGTTRHWNEQDHAGTNSHNVVLADGVTDVELNGFFITAGRCENGLPGAALRSVNSSLVINRCLIRGNYSSGDGAGIFASSDVESHTLEMNHCMFLTNFASGNGTCVYVGSNMTLAGQRVDLHGNQAGLKGAGLYFDHCDPSVIENFVIAGNKANLDGAACSVVGSDVSLNHLTITGNSSTSASGTKTGGVLVEGGGHVSGMNTILWRNANQSFTMDSSTAEWKHCIVAGSGGSSEWLAGFGTDLGGNHDEDPLFTTDLDPSSAPTLDGNLGGSVSFFPTVGSLAIDGGTAGSLESLVDAEGYGRISNGVRDIGAVEYQANSKGYYGLMYPHTTPIIDLQALFGRSDLTFSFELDKGDVLSAEIIGDVLMTTGLEGSGTRGRSDVINLFGHDGSGIVQSETIWVIMMPRPIVTRSADGTMDVVTYMNRTDRGEFILQVSDDLINWTDSEDLTGDDAIQSETLTDDGNGYEYVERQFTPPSGSRFYRVSMSNDSL